MKIFISYGHDGNVPLIEQIRNYLTKGSEGKPGHDVWIDTSEVKAGEDWRRKITEGILQSDTVLAGLSKHSTNDPGVCRDEIMISIGVKGGNIKTILLEPSDVVAPPAMISHIQWLDMSDWKDHLKDGFECEYFQEKFRKISEMIETPENEKFNEEITELRYMLDPLTSINRIKALTQNIMYGREWLFDEIKKWDECSKQRIFWIMAGPGFGKSTFAANLQNRYNARIPAVQFIEWGKPDHSNPCRILKNLAFQLAVRFPEYRKFILQLPRDTKNSIEVKNENELFELLFCECTWLKIDGNQENVWVLIDALDEANDERGNQVAETLARHIDRMPHWLKFIITSRNDSKVRLPLQQFKPQVVDLEENVKRQNDNDLLLFVQNELSKLHPSDYQISQLLEKSQGSFLYLSQCVKGILDGVYFLDNLELLPDGLNGYYYEFFTRQFGRDIKNYRTNIAPVLELIAASPSTMTLQFLKYVAKIESEYQFYEILSKLEHVLSIHAKNNSEKANASDTSLLKEITFLHNSIENWLTDEYSSGKFYVSIKDGRLKLAQQFIRWMTEPTSEEDGIVWKADDAFRILVQTKKALPLNIKRERLQLLVPQLAAHAALGTFARANNSGRQAVVDYCRLLLSSGKEDEFLSFIIELFELVKDRFAEIGARPKDKRHRDTVAVDLVPSKVFTATSDAATIGSIIYYLFKKNEVTCSEEVFEIIIRILNVLVYYEAFVRFMKYPKGSMEDLLDFNAIELTKLVVDLRIEHNQSRTSNEESSCALSDDQITALFLEALSKRHPEWYDHDPNNYSVERFTFYIGKARIYGVSD